MIGGDKVHARDADDCSGGLGNHSHGMSSFDRLFAGRLAIAFAVVFALLSVPTGASAFHDAAAKGHATVAALDDCGHSHDVDTPSGDGSAAKVAGDHHKHNPGDHSHEKLGIPPEVAVPSAVRTRERLLSGADAALPGITSTLHRPPRPSDIA